MFFIKKREFRGNQGKPRKPLNGYKVEFSNEYLIKKEDVEKNNQKK